MQSTVWNRTLFAWKKGGCSSYLPICPSLLSLVGALIRWYSLLIDSLWNLWEITFRNVSLRVNFAWLVTNPKDVAFGVYAILERFGWKGCASSWLFKAEQIVILGFEYWFQAKESRCSQSQRWGLWHGIYRGSLTSWLNPRMPTSTFTYTTNMLTRLFKALHVQQCWRALQLHR